MVAAGVDGAVGGGAADDVIAKPADGNRGARARVPLGRRSIGGAAEPGDTRWPGDRAGGDVLRTGGRGRVGGAGQVHADGLVVDVDILVTVFERYWPAW